MCLKAENKTKEQLKKPKLEIMIAYCPLPCETILKHIFLKENHDSCKCNMKSC